MRNAILTCLAALAGCSTSPETCQTPMSCAGGTITYCVGTMSCSYRTSNGTSFACDDCAHCQDAAGAAANWCAGGGVGGLGYDAGLNHVPDAAPSSPYDLGPNVTLHHLLDGAAISVQPGQVGVYQAMSAGRYGIMFLLAQDPLNPPAAMVFTVESPADITAYTQGGVTNGAHAVTYTTPTDLSQAVSFFFTLVPADAPFELTVQAPDPTIHYVTASGLATTPSPGWFVSP